MSIGSTVFKPSLKAKPFIPNKPANPSIMIPQPNMSQQNFYIQIMENYVKTQTRF